VCFSYFVLYGVYVRPYIAISVRPYIAISVRPYIAVSVRPYIAVSVRLASLTISNHQFILRNNLINIALSPPLTC
jgi:hypothetical protein